MSLADDDSFLYAIDISSSLLPKLGSEPLEIIRCLRLFVALYRLQESEARQFSYEYQGRFWIRWEDDAALQRAELLYDYPRDVLSLSLKKLNVRDEEVVSASVFSLADITPGAVAVKVQVDDDRLCEHASRSVMSS